MDPILKKSENFRKGIRALTLIRCELRRKRSRPSVADAGIIRNRLKVNAAIENAKRIQVLSREWFIRGWLDSHHH